MLGWLLEIAATAQEAAPPWRIDTHGRVARPEDGSVDEGVLVGAGRLPASFTASTLAHYAHHPAIRVGDPAPMVGALAGLDLRGSGRVGRFGWAASLPAFGLATTFDGATVSPGPPRLGDLHLWAPIAALSTRDGGAADVLVTPWARLPTGGAWTSDRGPSVGATTTLGVAFGPLRLGAEVGLFGRWREPLAYADGGAVVARLGGRVGVAGSRVAVHAEVAIDAALSGLARVPEAVTGVGSPAEGALTARTLSRSGWFAVASGGLGLNNGLGAPDLRVQAGFGFARPATRPDPRPERAPRPDVLAAVPVSITIVDEAGRIPEGVATARRGDVEVTLVAEAPGNPFTASLAPGEWSIEVRAPGFGAQTRAVTVAPGQTTPVRLEAVLLPDAGPGDLRLVVRDPEGRPIPDAQARIDGRPVGGLGTDGAVAVTALAVDAHPIEVSAEGFRAATLVQPTPPGTGATVALDRLPGSVLVIARTREGRVVDAVVRFEGRLSDAAETPVRLAAASLGDAGERRFVLRPGAWQVVVASPTYGLQQRALVVRADDPALTVVEVVLQPAEAGQATLAVRLVDPDGAPVDGVGVRLDGREVGRSSSGGTLTLSGLDAGERRLTLDAGPDFRPTPLVSLVLHDGPQERVFTLAYVPGVVRIRARTPERPVGDAAARFAGPAPVAALPLGPSGVATTRLAAGAWGVVVASPTEGLQQRDVAIAPDERRRIDVDVVLGDRDDGPGAVRLRVRDGDDRPVAGADVAIDGAAVGRTSNLGAVTLPGVDRGKHTVVVAAEAHGVVTQAITVGEGELAVDVALPWAPGAVRVVATSGGQPVGDGIVRVAGPTVVPPRPLDPQGERVFGLAPGVWQVVVVSPSAGIAQVPLTLTGRETGLVTVPVAFGPADPDAALLYVRVEDGSGQPVPGASVDAGAATARTGAGGAALIAGLPPGPSPLRVSADGYRPAEVGALRLVAGPQERIVVLDGIPVPVDVQVADATGAPIDADVHFDGPVDVATTPVGADGRETVLLPTGIWSVIAASPDRGAARATVTVRPPGPVPVKLTLRGARVDLTDAALSLREPVRFAIDAARPGPESAAILDEAAALLLAHPELRRVEVQGHSDTTGNLAYNLALSEARAQAVRDALVARGVPAERLVARGYGATRPVAPNTDDAGRALNRRVQIAIVERAR